MLTLHSCGTCRGICFLACIPYLQFQISSVPPISLLSPALIAAVKIGMDFLNHRKKSHLPH